MEPPKESETLIDKCSICSNELNKKTIIKTQCDHQFHLVCLTTWIKEHNTCPNCREIINLDVDDTKVNIDDVKTDLTQVVNNNEQGVYNNNVQRQEIRVNLDGFCKGCLVFCCLIPLLIIGIVIAVKL